MIKRILIFLIFLLPFSLVYSQNHTISGYVEDEATGERLIGCIVKDADNNRLVTTTNSFGFFSLRTTDPNISLKVIYIGYRTFEEELFLTNDTTFTVELSFENEIEEVVVTADRQNLQSTQMSTIDVSLQKMQKLPVIFGETDLLKTLQLMPGVQSGTEGSNGIYVRGGGPDQNLILLDGVPVYNVSHMFGFFSVFNTEAIKNVTLYKGGFPAHYGGRLSSVIDVQMKDGNMKKLSGVVSVGIIASKFTIEGPIKTDKTSFIISGRRTYIDLLAQPFIKIFAKETNNDPGGNYSYTDSYGGGYYFYDLNAKLTHNLTSKDRIFLSFYGGQDIANFKYKSEGKHNGIENTELIKAGLGWGNIITAARWNHSFNRNLFLNTTLTYSRFNFGVGLENSYIDGDYEESFNVGYSSGIDDIAAMVNFDYIPNVNHKIKFGFNAIYHTFRPGNIDFKMKITDPAIDYDSTFGSSTLNAPEYAAYFEDDFKVTDWLKINIGGRISMFDVRDTMYWNPEPRVAARILASDNFSIKFSYVEMMQYLHFLTNNTVGLPIDLWVPATNITVPEESWQAAVGFSWLIKDKYTLSVEGFYKEMDNLVEFNEGQSIFSLPSEGGNGESWEQKVSQGNGWAYGGEIFLQKNYGDFSGWFSYTLAWTDRKFPNIDDGNIFPYKYDRRHDISLVLMYDLNENINFGFTWVYGSGTPITLQKSEFLGPMGISSYSCGRDGCIYSGLANFGGRNNYRLPSYHRLDLSANFTKERTHGVRTWSVGVYNAYNHINPFYTMITSKNDWQGEGLEQGKTYLRIFSIFPVMPSVSYKFVW